MTIDYGLGFVSNLQGKLLVEVSCLTLSLYLNSCMNTRKHMYKEEAKLLTWQ